MLTHWNGVVAAGGSFTSIGGQTRNRVAAIDRTTGLPTAWDPDANNIVYVLLADGTNLYAGGAFTFIGGQTRRRLASLEPDGTATFTWDPNCNGTVFGLALHHGRLYVGGGFSSMDSRLFDNHLSMRSPILLDTPERPVVAHLSLTLTPNPARGRTSMRFTLPTAGPLSSALYDAAGRRVYSIAESRWTPAGVHEWDVVRGAVRPGIYFVRLQAGIQQVTRKLVVLE